MYVTTSSTAAPVEAGGAGRIPLPLARVLSRRFDATSGYSQAGLRIITDMAASYGLADLAAPLAHAVRTTFTEMVASVADELADGTDPLGLVLLAHGVADAEPQWPACYLAGVLPGEPLAFAVADDGVTTAFLALRIAAAYIRAEGVRRAAVIVLDQPALLRAPGVHDLAASPTENRMAVLEFAEDGGLGTLSVELTPDTSRQDAAGRVASHAATCAGSRCSTIVGGALAAASGVEPGPALRTAPAGRPCTGVWTELAAHLDRPMRAEPNVLLIDHDPALRLLGECRLGEPGGASQPER